MMNNLVVALTLQCMTCGALCGRHYIAIPVDDIDGIDIIEVNPIEPSSSKVVRQAETHMPQTGVSGVTHQEDSGGQRLERSVSRILDYVDFGGHTGSNGAFSWYADYPAHRF